MTVSRIAGSKLARVAPLIATTELAPQRPPAPAGRLALAALPGNPTSPRQYAQAATNGQAAATARPSAPLPRLLAVIRCVGRAVCAPPGATPKPTARRGPSG